MGHDEWARMNTSWCSQDAFSEERPTFLDKQASSATFSKQVFTYDIIGRPVLFLLNVIKSCSAAGIWEFLMMHFEPRSLRNLSGDRAGLARPWRPVGSAEGALGASELEFAVY